MSRIFSVQDRQGVYDCILSVARACSSIVALVQVGSGAEGFRDERSDLDFVIALDSDDSMVKVMDYMSRALSGQYEIVFSTRNESRHLQNFILSNLLEIDLGYGGYEHAAAMKPAFRVLYDHSGIVEEKMIRSREWMDDKIYGDKQKKDIETACRSVWIRLMHAAVAIHRGNTFRAIGELEYVRKVYVDLLGDRYRLESGLNREIDRLPEGEKALIRSTFVTGESAEALWTSLLNLTRLVYQELEEYNLPVTQNMLHDYYSDLRS